MTRFQDRVSKGANVVPLKSARRDGESSQTMASTLFEAIRSDIIKGQLAPGSKLKIQELSERYGAGTIPVREALSRLATSGFVDARDQRGFSVRGVSAHELVDLNRTRVLLEGVAVRDSIEHGDLSWESRILAVHYRMAHLRPFTELDGRVLNLEWEAAHDEFHHCILSACTSPWLLEFVETLRHQMARYRHISARAQPTGNRDVAGEHRTILEAVLARNAERAVELLGEHFTRSTTNALNEGVLGQQFWSFSGSELSIRLPPEVIAKPSGSPKA